MDCCVSNAPDHPDLKVVKLKGSLVKRRRTFRVAGVSPPNNISTFNNTIDAAECAVKERVFYVQSKDGTFTEPPAPIENIFNESRMLEELRKRVKASTPMSSDDFVSSFRGRKHTTYSSAKQSLDVTPIRKKDAYINSFLKFEKYNFKPNKRPVPRVISPRGPRFVVSMGRFIKPIEKKLYRYINEIFGAPTILKGMNQEDRGEVISLAWSSFKRPVGLTLDASRFDQHTSADALAFEHLIYSFFYPGNKEFKKLCGWQIDNTSFMNMMDGVMWYKRKGGRQSGDPNTSCGNCLIATTMLYNFILFCGFKMRLINDGDDCVLIFEDEHLDFVCANVHRYCLRYGYNMTIDSPVYELERIVFCQSQPVLGNAGYVMIRDPHVTLGKDAVSLKPLDNVSVAEMWLSAIGNCGLATMGGFPIFQSYYSMYLRHSNGRKPLSDPVLEEYVWFASLGMDRSEVTHISDQTRYSFWLAFGIAPEEQLAIEEIYDNMQLSPEINEERQPFITLPL